MHIQIHYIHKYEVTFAPNNSFHYIGAFRTYCFCNSEGTCPSNKAWALSKYLDNLGKRSTTSFYPLFLQVPTINTYGNPTSQSPHYQSHLKEASRGLERSMGLAGSRSISFSFTHIVLNQQLSSST